MRVAGIQLRLTADARTNLERAETLIHSAARRGARLICLPELMPYIYFPATRDLAWRSKAEVADGPTTNRMALLARRLGVWILSTLYEDGGNRLTYNTALLLDPAGTIRGRFRKLHVPRLAWTDEKAYFAPGDLGCPVTAVEDVKVGVAICYDRHFPEVGRLAALQGADGLLIPTASRSMVGRANVYHAELISRALENSLYVLGVNRWGDEGATAFFGRSASIDPYGRVLQALGSTRNGVVLADWDPRVVAQARQQFAQLDEIRLDVLRQVIEQLERNRNQVDAPGRRNPA